jgi:hypothetical protein
MAGHGVPSRRLNMHRSGLAAADQVTYTPAGARALSPVCAGHRLRVPKILIKPFPKTLITFPRQRSLETPSPARERLFDMPKRPEIQVRSSALRALRGTQAVRQPGTVHGILRAAE